MFNINFKYLIAILTPPILRNVKFLQWMNIILSSIRNIYLDFLDMRVNWLYDINFTAQIMYLEKKLQAELNTSLISITDGYMVSLIYLQNEASNEQPLFIYNEPENSPVFISNLSELDNEIDFYVNVPTGSDATIINNIIRKYNILGKTYLILENE